jgi:hypothetical protein
MTASNPTSRAGSCIASRFSIAVGSFCRPSSSPFYSFTVIGLEPWAVATKHAEVTVQQALQETLRRRVVAQRSLHQHHQSASLCPDLHARLALGPKPFIFLQRIAVPQRILHRRNRSRHRISTIASAFFARLRAILTARSRRVRTATLSSHANVAVAHDLKKGHTAIPRHPNIPAPLFC